MLQFRNIARASVRLPRLARFNSSHAQVTLDDDAGAAEIDGFFNYKWGRWLENNDQERAKRETRFSLKGLYDVLEQHVPRDGKAAGEKLQIKTIGALHEGKHHKVYKIELANDAGNYVLRIPYSLGHDEYRKHRMQSEIATMDFLRKKHSLAVPEVLAWSPVKENPLGSEYTLMQFQEGELLMKSWNPAVDDIQGKSKIIKPVVDFMDKILATPFNKYGSLYFTEDVDSKYQNDVPYANERDSSLVDRWRIGPTTESRFWKAATADALKATEHLRGPFDTASEYLLATAAIQQSYLTADSEATRTFEQYAYVVPELFKEEELADNPVLMSPRLHHPDLSPMNVIVNGDKSYLVDFESTAIRPFLLHGAPKFVQHKGLKVYSLKDIPEYEEMPPQEQKSIQYLLALTQNQFAFEYLFKQLGKEDLFGAFLPSIKRRQQLVQTALESNSLTYPDLAYDLGMLSQEWQFLGLDRESPLKFTDQELNELASKVGEWNQYILEHPFMETGGWLPSDTFDQLVSEGHLVKNDKGDYEYKRQ